MRVVRAVGPVAIAWLVVATAGCELVFRVDTHGGDDGIEPPVDARFDGSSSFDVDGDGVTDDIDNCLGAPNPTQADEDDDGVGNVCDNCPERANPDQVDGADDDEIGDACDPAPACDGDQRLLFEPFDDVLAGWSDDTSTWMVMGGGVQPQMALGENGLTAPADWAVSGWYRANTGVVDTLSPNDGDVAGVVLFGAPMAAFAGIRCQTERLIDDSLLSIVSNDNEQSQQGTSAVETEFEIQLDVLASTGPPAFTAQCSAGGEVQIATSVITGPTDLPAGWRGGLYTDYRRVRFDYLVVYYRTFAPPTSGGPCPL
jgi:hypothetical protein